MEEKSFEDYLKSYFGFSNFRPKQKEIIETIVNHQRDVISIMSTGYGKSICYQLPALIMNKPSVIISPLISLMEDQKIKLESLGISSCCYNSTCHNKLKTQEEIFSHKYNIIYITPETVVTSQSLLTELNSKIGISLIAIDEAHCVSLWGNSFRSSYLQLSCLKSWLPEIPILALTGTATPKVETDMSQLLCLHHPLLIRTGSDRSNIMYYVYPKTDPSSDLLPQIFDTNDNIIIYCPTRQETEDIAKLLIDNGIPAEAYHAGLSQSSRNKIHHDFIDGTISCIVATISFGMGIDISNIRKVIHYGCPKDIESYHQESGRAGRDGLPSTSIVFFKQSDFATNRFFLKDINDNSLRIYKENMIHTIEQYLYISTCRREFILKYFGEKIAIPNPNCCDNCSSTSSNTSSAINFGIETKKFLSLIHDFGGKYGKLMYINVIRGANLKTIPDRFKSSVHYGVGKDRSLDWWKTFVQHLINTDYIYEKSSSGNFGSLINISNIGSNWLYNNDTNPIFNIQESTHLQILFTGPKVVTKTLKQNILTNDIKFEDNFKSSSEIELVLMGNNELLLQDTENPESNINTKLSIITDGNQLKFSSSNKQLKILVSVHGDSLKFSISPHQEITSKLSLNDNHINSFPIPKVALPKDLNKTNLPSFNFNIPVNQINLPKNTQEINIITPKSEIETSYDTNLETLPTINFPIHKRGIETSSNINLETFPTINLPIHKREIETLPTINFPIHKREIEPLPTNPHLKVMREEHRKNMINQSVLKPTQFQTYQLSHNDMKTIEEIANIRGLTSITIENHLMEAISVGLPYDINRLPLNKAKYEEILSVIQGPIINSDISKLKPIKEACTSDTTYLQIRSTIAIQTANIANRFRQ